MSTKKKKSKKPGSLLRWWHPKKNMERKEMEEPYQPCAGEEEEAQLSVPAPSRPDPEGARAGESFQGSGEPGLCWRCFSISLSISMVTRLTQFSQPRAGAQWSSGVGCAGSIPWAGIWGGGDPRPGSLQTDPRCHRDGKSGAGGVTGELKVGMDPGARMVPGVGRKIPGLAPNLK